MEEWKKVLLQNQDQRKNLVARGHTGYPGGYDRGGKTGEGMEELEERRQGGIGEEFGHWVRFDGGCGRAE